MITYLPDFLPDELFYSYVARYHYENLKQKEWMFI